MFLIMSGAYVTDELRAEFGQVPPSFLPLGNKRLFNYQLELAEPGEDKFISLPESYNLSAFDLSLLEANNVKVIRTPDSVNLGQSLVIALSIIDHPLDRNLSVLFGDTLINTVPDGDDVLVTSKLKESGSYNWSTYSSDGIAYNDTEESLDLKQLVCGYFRFSQPVTLIRAIINSSWDFIEGLNRYKEVVGLRNVITEEWLDFGHVNTYYKSKASFTTQRSFNELDINAEIVTKRSKYKEKIRAEANWYKSLPHELKIYTPQFISDSNSDEEYAYTLEYLHNVSLNELFVFTNSSIHVWSEIIGQCLAFIEKCSQYPGRMKVDGDYINIMFEQKTIARLDQFCSSKQLDLDGDWLINGQKIGSFENLLREVNQFLPSKRETTVIHGDFCFSNILFDFRSNRIKTIDPRGLDIKSNMTIYGDLNYDLAKLSHSVIGLYDWIIAGYHSSNVDWEKKEANLEIGCSEHVLNIQRMFISKVKEQFNIAPVELYAMQIHLFLSMLPLHNDDKRRQNALFANALRIYQLLKKEKG